MILECRSANAIRPRCVVVVGAGLAGTATAIRLLQFAREPVRIVVLERRPGYRGAGVAHHPESNHWHHVFNIQAGRMSAFREDVDDFVDWANREADRTGWPPPWRDFTFVESGPAPRRIYRDYLTDRLAHAAREAAEGVALVEADGDVEDLVDHAGHVDVVVRDLLVPGGDRRERVTIAADHVVLATGLERRFPAFAAGVADDPAFVAQPYSAAGQRRILAVRPDAVVAIVGSLLSAYDSATLLLRRGHTGRIHLLSRSGLILRAYPPDHRHQVIDLPPPRFDEESYADRDTFVQRFTEEWERACATVARDHPEISPAVVTERVFKAWEPFLPDILARLSSADLRALLDGYGSLLAVLRVGVMPYTAGPVDAAMGAGGPVVVTAGRVEEIRRTGAGTLAVTVSGRTTTSIEADLVISNFGRESDYTRVDVPLWANLLRNGLACAHRRTGRGVEVDDRGRLITASGRPAPLISVVGHPREGDEIVRNGRLGAFTFNLAAIKNHSVEVAAAVLCDLESCYDTTPADIGGLAPDVLRHATTLDVRRMTARRRDLRQSLTARLEDDLGALGHAGPVSTLRFLVTSAATARLKDLSVTPRELRTTLGLERRLEPID